MKKALLLLLFLPSVSFADRLGGLTPNSQVLLTTQAVSGASSLAIRQDGVIVSSPTSVINFVSPMAASLLAGTTSQVTIDTTSASGVLSRSSNYVSSLTVNSALIITGTNNAPAAVPIVSLNSSSVTLYGPNIPAASISAGSLGSSVLASSLTATGVTAGSYTNSNITVNAQGRITSASNGSASGGSALTVTTGSTTGYNSPPTTSAATAVIFDSSTFMTQLISGTSVFMRLNPAVTSGSNGTIFAMTASSSVTNSTAETNVVGLGSGTITLPSNYLAVGKTLRIKASGTYISTTSAGSFTFKFKLGNTVIVSTASIPLVDNQINQLWSFGIALTCRSSGSSGTVFGNTSFGMYDGTNGYRNAPMTMISPVTVDTTVSQQISITAQFSVANASNTFTTTNFVVVGETVTTVGGVAGGSGTPAGSNTNVQYNNNGSFGGDSGFQYDSSVDSVTISGKLGVGGPVTFSSTTIGLFDIDWDACQAKLPGANAPYISNSTGEISCSIYFDDTSTQTVTYTGIVKKYSGRPLYADIIFTSTATSGSVNWGIYTATNTPNSNVNNYDSSTYNVMVSTAWVMSSPSNSLQCATVALSNTTTRNGDFLTVKLERQAGNNDTAVGFGRLKKLRIYE